uniref:Zygote-expressed homeodomain protein n=1 Tax=Chlamydomonas reinhardtii TaxID=3055 RepID=B0F9V7_CHLRE|nr:zygote-expressed homeodomain protein [Chlamydomonas reinhardtii]
MEGDAGAPDLKPKATKPRANKTPLQKEVLEASYQLNQHPSIDHRKALGDRIGLTEQEVQAWFTNRRRKDKLAEAKKATATPPPAGTPSADASAGASPGGPVAGAPAGTIPHAAAGAAPSPGAVAAASPKPKVPRAPKAPKLSPAGASPVVPGQSPPAAAPAAAAAEEEETDDGEDEAGPAAAAWENIRQLCVAARATLPVPYREDGPELGFLFDEPPMPGESAGGGGKRRRVAGPEGDAGAGGSLGGPEGVGSVLLRRPGGNKPIVGQEAGPVGVMTVAELEMRRQQLLMQQQQQQAVLDAARAQAEANGGGAPTGATAKAINAMQKEQERLRKELLKQQERMERERKREADERHRELERHQKEQRKLNDKMEKERAKEEARKLKEMEKMKIAEERELKRLEAAREKERKAEERRKAVEERKKEKDTRRALIQQERLVLRQRHREGAAVPPDDEELEYRALLEAAGIDPATIALDPEEDAAQAAAQAAADQALADAGVPVPAATPPPRKRPRPDLPRPPFPPPSLELHPAWPAPERQPPAASTAAAGAAAAAENGGDAEMADAEAQPQPPEATPAPEGAQPQLQSDAQPEAEAEEELSDSLDPDLGTELLVCWSFLQSFADLFGVAVPSLEQLLGGLAAGEDSRLLGDVHCALLRLLQADMEDAHDEKERVGRPTANVPHFMDKSVAGSAQRLEEAWAWGFDVDAWRAHLNTRTWPEVLRQVAIVWGRGRARPAVRRPAQDLGKGPRIQGMDGEDVLDDGATGGSLKLRMPQRYTHGTVKAAAWQVLANVGPNGLSVGDLVRRIQKQGLREMRSSKTPEAVVAGSLARDVLFTKVAPATWALTAVVDYHKRKNEARERREAAGKKKGKAGEGEGAGAGKASDGGAAPGGDGGDAEMADATAGAEEGQVKEEAGVKKEGGAGRKVKKEPGAAAAPGVKEEPKEDATGAASPAPMDTDAPGDGVKQEPKDGGEAGPSSGGAEVKTEEGKDGAGNEEEEYSGEEEEQQQEEEEQQAEEETASRGARDAWVAALLEGGYGSLRLRQRIEALSFLCHAVLDGPTVRAKLELRTEEAMARKKAVFEEAKNDKRKRQEEAALRAAAAAEEARKKAEAAAAAAAAGGGAAPGGDGATPVPGSRGATPAPGAPVDPKAIAAELFGAGAAGAGAGAAAAVVPTDPAKAAEEAKRRAEEEEEDKIKRQQRAEEVRRIDEECAIRAEPLGSDRRHNRYWLFTSGSPDDAGTARLWVELAPEGRWRLLTSPEAFDQLVAALEPRGLREGALAQALARVADTVKAAMPGIAPVADPTPYDALPDSARAALEATAVQRGAVARLAAAAVLAADDDDYTEGLDFLEADSGPVSALKRDLLRLEAAVPADAMAESFHSLSWKERVMNAPGLPELRACLGQLEAALLASPDGTTPGLLATVFHRNPPLVRGAWVEVGREVATALPGHASKEILPPVERPDGGPPPEPNDEPLAWLPATLPALALRLLALDAHIVYREGAPAGRECLAGYRYTIRPAPLDAQPLALPAGEDDELVPAASAALPLAAGGGAVVLTNVLADRGRVREANRRVPELPAEVMAMRARDFSLPVDDIREQVEEAEREGLFNVVPTGTGTSGSAAAVAALAASVGGSKKKGKPLPVALPPGATTKRSSGSKSVVIVRQPTPGVGAAAPGGKSKKGATAAGGGGRKGAAAAGAAAPKADKKGGTKSKKAAAAATPPPAAEEDADDDAGVPAEGLDEPLYLEDDWEDEGNEEGLDDPDDSDYGF